MTHAGTKRFASRPRLRGLLGLLAGLALAASLVGTASTALSQTAASPVAKAEGPSWQSLSPAQRAALAPMERDWAGIDANRKAKWLEVAARFPRLPQEEQQRIQERMRAWVAMSPQQRGRARLTFQESRQLAPQERQQRWETYQSLPPERRAALEQRLHTTGPSAADARDAQRGREKKVVINPPGREAGPGKVVAPTVVQAQNGATTSLVNKLATPPVHQQPGMPKIAATPNFVDRTTLLPKRGPQGAESRGVASAASAPATAPQHPMTAGRAGSINSQAQVAPALQAPALWRRLACMVYEGVVLFGVVMIFGYLYSSLTQQRHALQGTTGLQVFIFLVLGIYFGWFWSRGGQTVAMKAWHLRLVDAQGRPVGQFRAVLRYALAWLWFLPALASLHVAGLKGGGVIALLLLSGMAAYAALTLLRPDRQFFHDALCGTRLIDCKPTLPAAPAK